MSPLTPKTEPTSDGGQESPIQIEISEKTAWIWVINLVKINEVEGPSLIFGFIHDV